MERPYLSRPATNALVTQIIHIQPLLCSDQFCQVLTPGQDAEVDTESAATSRTNQPQLCQQVRQMRFPGPEKRTSSKLMLFQQTVCLCEKTIVRKHGLRTHDLRAQVRSASPRFRTALRALMEPHHNLDPALATAAHLTLLGLVRCGGPWHQQCPLSRHVGLRP